MHTKKTICIMLCILLFVLILPNFIFAAGTSRTWDEQTEENKSIRFKPQIEIPGMDKIFTNKTDEGYKIDGNTIGNFIKVVYNYSLGIIGIIAAIVLMWGGFMWLTAGGSSERMSEAKSWITASLSGLLIALTAYLILATVNPDLVIFKGLEVEKINKNQLICCEHKAENGTTEVKLILNQQCTDLGGKISIDKVPNGNMDKCINKVNEIITKCCQAQLDGLFTDTNHCTDIFETELCNTDLKKFNVKETSKLKDIIDLGNQYECNHENGKCEPRKSSAYK